MEGFIEFSVSQADDNLIPLDLPSEVEYIAIAVKDSGIGIPADKTDIVFEAFQQVDGTTSRKFGGTGLGLSISRELARLMGGAIVLESREGQGSTFTMYLPVIGNYNKQPSVIEAAASREDVTFEEYIGDMTPTLVPTPVHEPIPQLMIDDDRDHLTANDKVLLIIEDDESFAKILLDMAHGRNFKGLVALQGDTGLQMAKTYLPDAIILDIQLPVMDGWTILRELKVHHRPATFLSMSSL